MSEILIRPDEAWRRCGISRSKMYALIQAGQFPKPIKITGRTTAFVEREIDAWILDQIERSRE